MFGAAFFEFFYDGKNVKAGFADGINFFCLYANNRLYSLTFSGKSVSRL